MKNRVVPLIKLSENHHQLIELSESPKFKRSQLVQLETAHFSKPRLFLALSDISWHGLRYNVSQNIGHANFFENVTFQECDHQGKNNRLISKAIGKYESNIIGEQKISVSPESRTIPFNCKKDPVWNPRRRAWAGHQTDL
jgi:hypothetical protein